MPSASTHVVYPTIEGGRAPLSKRQRQAVSFFTDVVRGLPDEQVTALIQDFHFGPGTATVYTRAAPNTTSRLFALNPAHHLRR